MRTYTWGAGRQLKHISMPAKDNPGKVETFNDVHVASETILQLVRAGNTLEAHVFRSGREITDERPVSAFVWTRESGNAATDATWNAAHAGMKQIAITDDDINGNLKFSCTYSEEEGSYGSVYIDDDWMVVHNSATADANHVFSLEDGMLKVTTSSANGTDYKLVNGTLFVNSGFTDTLTSSVTFNNDAKTLEIDFSYDHNGLRTQKKVVDNLNNTTTTYDYTLHGKLITHLTKRVVNEEGIETSKDELHFFYDAQSQPAFVEYGGTKYRYVHNLQGDIVAIVDPIGNPVVEYKYDAWGEIPNNTAYTGIGDLNPFRYRGYIYDDENTLYYLGSRYYCCSLKRFLNADTIVCGVNMYSNVYCYCNNNPVKYIDNDGYESVPITPTPSRSINWDEEFEWSYYFTPAGVFYYGEPNSYRAWKTNKGEWMERWYGEDGTPVRDRHWTDHGYPKTHPHVPHDEDWKDDGKGGKTLDTKSSRPSPKNAKKPSQETSNSKFSIDWSGSTKGAEKIAIALIIFIGIGAVTGGSMVGGAALIFAYA